MTVRARWAPFIAGLGLLAVTAAVTGCSGSSGSTGRVNLRLGYFPNLTHATPIVGLDKGIYAQHLGKGVKLDAKSFNAGPDAIQAVLSGALDATYVGPNPTVNAWQKTRGKAIRVIAGAASGGVALVVKPGIGKPADLKGRTLATPQLGNTQDVALRYWLRQHHLTATNEGGGDVHIKPQDNGQTLTAFGTGGIDGGWLPEPYASQLVNKGGKVLVDERTLWPDGRFVITNLVVRTDFLEQHPDVVRRLLDGQVETTGYIRAHPADAQQAVSTAIGKLTGKPLDPKLLAQAWPSLEFTNDPVASSLVDGAKHAEQVGLLGPVNLGGLYDLSALNQALEARSEPQVKA